MKLTNVIYKLYADPWVIEPGMHRTLCEIVRDHVTGAAHAPGGRALTWGTAEPAPAKPAESGPQISGGVMRIMVDGVIGRRLDDLTKSSGGVDALDIGAALEAAARDPDVGGVLMVFDSPGGTVAGIPELAAQIRKAAAVKPLVALASGVMASGAYWLGSQARAVYAEPSAQIGSIGAYHAFLDQSRQYASEGLAIDLFSTGKFKGMGISGLPLTAEQKEHLQARVDQVFGWFKADLALARAIPESAMDGRTFFAGEALVLDMIDAIGGESEALAELRDMMGA